MAEQNAVDAQLSLERFIRGTPDAIGAEAVTIVTTRGDIALRYYAAAGATTVGGAIFVGSAEEGQPRPAGGQLYPAVCKALVTAGVACVELSFRTPDDFHECVLDVLGAMAFLDECDAAPVALVAHSLSSASAVQVALLSPDVGACALLSAVAFEDAEEYLPHLGPRCAMLYVHGALDLATPLKVAQQMFELTSEPKQWLPVPDVGHALDSADDTAIVSALSQWIVTALQRPEARND
ncbi:MAG TPA: alpha/beta hydrolase [Tepidisphaeraceae bacterium]|jgi:fermentation-respiration switch protein FrsA (DUF1100 family)|nr:alpha/beta hydrolase [Tepidisphaeraceae bacterium]